MFLLKGGNDVYGYDVTETRPRELSHIKVIYAWMTLGLLLTAFVASYVATNVDALRFALDNIFALLIVELIFVFAIARGVTKFSPTVSSMLFLIYAGLNGLTLSIIFLAYTKESIATTFFITAGMFATMSLYGFVTKRDLTKLGSILFMALIGLILATIVNIFLQSSGLYWIISFAGVLIFVGLTAYDTQKIKNNSFYEHYPIAGALTLYLDFINMFIYLLRIFGIGGKD